VNFIPWPLYPSISIAEDTWVGFRAHLDAAVKIKDSFIAIVRNQTLVILPLA
jgi:hypothetical protein